MPRLLPLRRLRERDRAVFGAKAVNLGLMASWGLPVPAGYALAFGARMSSELGDEERERIRRAYANLASGLEEPPAVAVRSSAVGEDDADFSFAGLHTSLVDVVGADAVVEAVAECLASQGGERAAAYRDEADAAIAGRAVILQPMVPADHAGICFTRSPTAEDEVVVELVSGLAEALAAGTRTPGRVRFAREGLDLRSTDDPGGLLERFGVDAARGVARLALCAEARFGYPLDVEWAATGGELHLLQARPIAAGDRLARVERIRRKEIERLEHVAAGCLRVWSDFSVADMFPRPTPLDLEIVRGIGRPGGGIERAVRRIGLRPTREPEADPGFQTICGRLYLSLGSFVKGADEDLPLALDTRRLPAADEPGLDPARMPLRLAWPGWRGLLRVPALLLRLAGVPFHIRSVRRSLARELDESLQPRATEEAARLRHRDLGSLSNRDLWKTLRSHIERIVDLVYYHQLTDYVVLFLLQMLRLPLRLLYGAGAEVVQTRLATGLPGNLNTETNLDLARVARGELDRETFLERYGHRGNPDWQISTPRWREDPSRVDAMIETIARAERDPIERFDEQARVRIEAERELSASIRERWWLHPFHRSILRQLRDYQRYSPRRETTQGVCYLFVELARNAALEAARRADLGELVFFFTLPELETWLVDGSTPELRARARARRRRLRAARTLFVPHVVRSDALEAIGRPPPLPADARRLEGQVAAAGTARGRARVVQSLEEARDLEPGEILVAASADPAWTPLFLVAGGAVLEQGGLLSHPAIVAREYGLPTVVNVPHATRIVRTGQILTVDADRGVVVVEQDEIRTGPP